MRHGIITKSQDWLHSRAPADHLVGAWRQATYDLDATPATWPVLHRLGSTSVARTNEALDRIEGAALYLTTDEDHAAVVAGRHDDELDALKLPEDTVVRINHEANGFPSAPWTGWSPQTWAAVYVYIAARLVGDVRDVADYACWIDRGRRSPDDWMPFAEALDGLDWAPRVVGWDGYVRDPHRRIDLARRYARYVATLRDLFPRSDIWVGEYGVARGPARRRVWGSIRALEGVDMVVHYDLGDTRLSGRMRDELGRWM